LIVVRGMYGVGDCLHQRAVIRDLMKFDEVVLETFYWSMYHDLIDQGLRLRLMGGIAPRIRDRKQSRMTPRSARDPRPDHEFRLTYHRDTIKMFGSILAAQYACVGLQMPERPDFSMSVPDAWREAAMLRVGAALRVQGASVPTKPLLVYRPSVLNDVWLSRARAPDPASYQRLYECIRDNFFVVSVANLGEKGEHIDGPEQPADIKFHRGELGFEELSGLFAEARLTLTCPGFSPVLSQTVGTPTAIVYGGNESFSTTNSVGKHLASTLALEPIKPCACHLKDHDCDKTMDIPLQTQRLMEFAQQCAA
jgi:hypothetical protein